MAECGSLTFQDVLRGFSEWDMLGPREFYEMYGPGPTTPYEVVWDNRRYPLAVLSVAWERKTGQRLAPRDFEVEKAVKELPILSAGTIRLEGLR